MERGNFYNTNQYRIIEQKINFPCTFKSINRVGRQKAESEISRFSIFYKNLTYPKAFCTIFRVRSWKLVDPPWGTDLHFLQKHWKMGFLAIFGFWKGQICPKWNLALLGPGGCHFFPRWIWRHFIRGLKFSDNF